jgi:hypothetical protein
MSIDTKNIYIELDKEIYIEELIIWLNERKKKYSKIKPTVDNKLIKLIVS